MRIMDTRHVSARHDSQERREAASLLQRGGEQARAWWARGAAARAVSGGDQILAGARGASRLRYWTRVVVRARGRWRYFRKIIASRRCLMNRWCGCGFRICGLSERDNGARMLAGVAVVARAGAGRVLGAAFAAESQGDALG